ncbi:MAG: carboxypeptidase-like regulatory domain-containing protein, partial [Candidatus Sulfotelmatobacter sp.]
MRSGSRVVTLLFVSLLILQNLTFSQSATSSLHGTITDAKGLVIAGASLTLTSAETGFSRTTTTEGQG